MCRLLLGLPLRILARWALRLCVCLPGRLLLLGLPLCLLARWALGPFFRLVLDSGLRLLARWAWAPPLCALGAGLWALGSGRRLILDLPLRLHARHALRLHGRLEEEEALGQTETLLLLLLLGLCLQCESAPDCTGANREPSSSLSFSSSSSSFSSSSSGYSHNMCGGCAIVQLCKPGTLLVLLLLLRPFPQGRLDPRCTGANWEPCSQGQLGALLLLLFPDFGAISTCTGANRVPEILF